MAPRKVWVNIYKHSSIGVHDTKEEADRACADPELRLGGKSYEIEV